MTTDSSHWNITNHLRVALIYICDVPMRGVGCHERPNRVAADKIESFFVSVLSLLI